MAVDPKTGKPMINFLTLLPVGRAFARDLARAGVIAAADVEAVAGDIVRAAPADASPPDAGPRGVSVLRGAYGAWLAAREWAKAEAKRQP